MVYRLFIMHQLLFMLLNRIKLFIAILLHDILLLSKHLNEFDVFKLLLFEFGALFFQNNYFGRLAINFCIEDTALVLLKSHITFHRFGVLLVGLQLLLKFFGAEVFVHEFLFFALDHFFQHFGFLNFSVFAIPNDSHLMLFQDIVVLFQLLVFCFHLFHFLIDFNFGFVFGLSGVCCRISFLL